MKVYPKIEAYNSSFFCKAILKLAKEKKLDKINFETRYNVVKQKAKKKHSYLPYSGNIIMRAFPYLVGNNNNVALFFYTTDEWFKTSGIIKCTKYKKFIRIETLNSVYKLYPWE